MKFKVKAAEEKTTTTGKPMYRATLVNDAGEETTLNIFDMKVDAGQEIEGETYVNDKGYTNFKPAQAKGAGGGRPNMDRIVEKKAALIGEAQDRKAENISHAQDRSAWMWAKNSAATLYANDRIGSKLENEDEAYAKIISFATKIYNAEPLTPFN